MNKRQLKKQIHGVCGGLAVDSVVVADTLPAIGSDKLGELIHTIAHAQTQALKRVSVSFDKTERDFANRAEYNKARRAYYKKAYRAMSADLEKNLNEVIGVINGALTPEQKEANKATAK